jgi:hypothetical protein
MSVPSGLTGCAVTLNVHRAATARPWTRWVGELNPLLWYVARAPGTEILEAIVDATPPSSTGSRSTKRHRILLRHFRQLSRRCQVLLRVVAFVDGHDYSAVADALEMPRGSIGPTPGRCLAKLREMLLAGPTWSASRPIPPTDS